MNKIEVKKLTNLIKGYYNNQFFVDDYVLEAWYETMKPYELDDAIDHIQTYIKDYPDTPPKPHTFKSGLYTPEQKKLISNTNYTIECNLCHRWMPMNEYETHYDRCLDIQYLLSVAKQKGEKYSREDLENCKPIVIDKLLEKYPPKKIAMENIGELFKW